MSNTQQCPRCGTRLPEDALGGLCPNCVLRAAAQPGADSLADLSGTGAGSTGDTFVPPKPAELEACFPELEILDLVARGGMGVVYRARQKHLDRIVALKILSPKVAGDPTFADRFAREARALARLSHPHIVAIHDFGHTPALQGRDQPSLRAQPGASGEEAEPSPPTARPGPLYYFLMEFVDGLNLRQLLDAGRLAPREALAIVPQICDALQYAHDHGIVHRDIKPENILLDRAGQVKIADFGLAKLAGKGADDHVLTGAGQVMGTPHYMAPEQIEHPQAVDHRADIYSLGVVFYQMLTGELPLGRFAPPSQKVAIDVRLDEVVLRALEKEPEQRYQQAKQVKTEVETIAGMSEPSASAHPSDTTNEPTRRHAKLSAWGCLAWAMAAALLFVAAATIVGMLMVPYLRINSSGKQTSVDVPAESHVTVNQAGNVAVDLARVETAASAVLSAAQARREQAEKNLNRAEEQFNQGTIDRAAYLKTFYAAQLAAAAVRQAKRSAPPAEVRAEDDRIRLMQAREELSLAVARGDAGVEGMAELNRARTAFHQAESAADPDAQRSRPTFSVRLSRGLTVRLLGVAPVQSSDSPSGPYWQSSSWWRPDGTALPAAPYAELNASLVPRDDEILRQLAVELENLPAEPVVTRWQFVPQCKYAIGAPDYPSHKVKPDDLRAAIIQIPFRVPSLIVRLGIADGPWRTVAEFPRGTAATVRLPGGIEIHPANEAEGQLTIMVVCPPGVVDGSARIVAVAKDNQESHASQSKDSTVNGSHRIEATFANVSRGDLRAFRLQVRPYQWIEFRNVTMQPGHKTEVIIEALPPAPLPAPAKSEKPTKKNAASGSSHLPK